MTELAIWALLELHVESETIIPAIAETLQSTNAHLREYAAERLTTAGARARPAVPALLKALEDPQVRVRAAATNTLRKVAPEML
jgi:HEAT repeat protein